MLYFRPELWRDVSDDAKPVLYTRRPFITGIMSRFHPYRWIWQRVRKIGLGFYVSQYREFADHECMFERIN